VSPKDRPHSGGRPPKACYVLIAGTVEHHANIQLAAARLGVSGAPGSFIRKSLNASGVYRPRGGAVCWLADGREPPEDAAKAFQRHLRTK